MGREGEGERKKTFTVNAIVTVYEERWYNNHHDTKENKAFELSKRNGQTLSPTSSAILAMYVQFIDTKTQRGTRPAFSPQRQSG